MNKFEQLVDDLNSHKMGMLHIQNALRAHTRHRPEIPEQIKDLLCGKNEGDGGLIREFFKLLQRTIGTTELAYRRGKQDT
mgnify:FL=1